MQADFSDPPVLSKKRRAGFKIQIAEEKCSGCKTCQLWCSFTWTETFNLLKSNIRQTFMPGKGFQIVFLDTCMKCGACADHCMFGALLKTKQD